MAVRKLDCALMTSRSWKDEDLALLPLLLRMTTMRGAGRFVELGAYTGVEFSNTLVLEKCFGWHGLLIEANSANFEKLQHSGRSAVLRRSAVCAGDGLHGQTVNITKGGGAVAGQMGAMSASFLSTEREGDDLSTEPVPCQSLTSLMERSALSMPIDFLSLGSPLATPSPRHGSPPHACCCSWQTLRELSTRC